jgi:hypothetical protein
LSAGRQKNTHNRFPVACFFVIITQLFFDGPLRAVASLRLGEPWRGAVKEKLCDNNKKARNREPVVGVFLPSCAQASLAQGQKITRSK